MKIKEGFELQNVCGDYIIVAAGEENMDCTSLIELNETAAFLWSKLCDKESFTVEDMTSLLLEEYDVEERIAREDSIKMAARWKEFGLTED